MAINSKENSSIVDSTWNPQFHIQICPFNDHIEFNKILTNPNSLVIMMTNPYLAGI